MSWFLLNRNLTPLEPYDWKLSRTVLRGERGSNAPDLPGIVFSENFARELYAHIVLLGRSDNMEQGVIMIEFVSYHLATLDCGLKQRIILVTLDSRNRGYDFQFIKFYHVDLCFGVFHFGTFYPIEK